MRYTVPKIICWHRTAMVVISADMETAAPKRILAVTALSEARTFQVMVGRFQIKLQNLVAKPSVKPVISDVSAIIEPVVGIAGRDSNVAAASEIPNLAVTTARAAGP